MLYQLLKTVIQTEIFDNNQQGCTNSNPSGGLHETLPNNPPSFPKTDEELSIKHSNPISVIFFTLFNICLVILDRWELSIF